MLEHVVEHLGRLQLAAQLPRYGPDRRLEHLHEPAVGDQFLGRNPRRRDWQTGQ